MLRPFPRTWLNGCRSAGSDGPRRPRHRVFPLSQRSFTPSVVCPNCLHRFCCRVAVDRPRVPLPVAMTLGHLTRSGGESEIVRLGVSVGALFKESGPLRSHVTTTAIGVETDQPRGRWPSGHHVRISSTGFQMAQEPNCTPRVPLGCDATSARSDLPDSSDRRAANRFLPVRADERPPTVRGASRGVHALLRRWA